MQQQKQNENEVEGWSNDVDLDTLRAQAKKPENWKQRGPMLTYEIDGVVTSTYIGMNLKLTGVEDGKPILEKV